MLSSGLALQKRSGQRVTRRCVRVQANLFERVVRVAKSYANALVSSVEDPEKVLDQAVEDMQNDLIRLRQGAAEVTASEKRMQAKYEQAKKTAVRTLVLYDGCMLNGANYVLLIRAG